MVQGEFISMSKGTIIYIGGFELPDKNAAAHRVVSNGKILRELGYEVIFIDIDRELEYCNNILNTKKLTQGFECWSISYPKTKRQWIHYLSNIGSCIDVLDQYKQSDVKAVIAYNYQAIPLIKLKSYCNKYNIKILADCTEWYSTKGTNLVFKIIKGFDSFLRMRVIQKRLDGLIVISRYLESYYSKSKNVVRIPPLVDLSENKWNEPMSKFNNNKINFVYVGSPGKAKDKFNLLLENLHDLKGFSNYTFNIIGITKKQYINDCKEHKRLLEGIGDGVKFHGRLSHNDSLEYVKMSDFSIFFRDDTRTTKAGFPTKFVESITCGTPVVTTKTSDLEDYITEGKNGFFIDIDNFNIVKILKMERKMINNMKAQCESKNIFDYQHYNCMVEKFMKRVTEN